MISIRTALVAAAFVAMGLTTAAERLAQRLQAQDDPFVSVGLDEKIPAQGLKLTQRFPVVTVAEEIAPWI